MKKLYSVTNFSQGINEYVPQGAADIQNFDITNDGALVTRDGWGGSSYTESLGGIDSGDTPLQVFFAGGSSRKMFVQTNKNIYYRSGSDAFTAVTNNTSLDTAALNVACSERWSIVVADNNRVFLTNTQANGQLWLDTSGTPTLYKWGVDAPTPDSGTSWDIDYTYDSGSSARLEKGIYAFAFAFELRHGGMSPLSNRIIATVPEDKNQVKITMTDIGAPTTWEAGIDKQITGLAVYRTDKGTTVSFSDAEGYEETLAKSAPLKYAGSLPISYSLGYFTNGTLSYGISRLAGQLEGSAKPPNLLTNITLYGGRIWGCVNGTDELRFSALDETAAPLYDIFPDEDAVVPHIIYTRDKITGIGASRDYLAVFSPNSIQLVRGQGVISGIYGKQQPGTDLDLSQYLTSMGAKNDHCVAEALGNVYFYSADDQRIYSIDKDGNVSWISQPVQGLLDSLEEETNSSIDQVVSDGGMVYVVRVNADLTTTLKYDIMRNRWTHYNLGSVARVTPLASNPSDFTGFQAGIYGLRRDSVDREVVRMFVGGVTSDNDGPITPVYESQEFNFPRITRLDSVRVGVESSTTVVLTVTTDGAQRTLPTSGTLTLNGNNNYTVRTFARGYKHQVKFQLTGAQTVRFFELQFRSR